MDLSSWVTRQVYWSGCGSCILCIVNNLRCHSFLQKSSTILLLFLFFFFFALYFDIPAIKRSRTQPQWKSQLVQWSDLISYQMYGCLNILVLLLFSQLERNLILMPGSQKDGTKNIKTSSVVFFFSFEVVNYKTQLGHLHSINKIVTELDTRSLSLSNYQYIVSWTLAYNKQHSLKIQ